MLKKRWQAAVLAAVALVGGGLGGASAGASAAVVSSTAAEGSVQALPAVAPGQVTGGPSDLSCPTRTWCAAVGMLDENGDAEPGDTSAGASVAAAWVLSGGAWHVSLLPLPSNAAGTTSILDLRGVSCAAIGHCVAIATYETTSDRLALVAETLAAGTWHPTTVPLAAHTSPMPEFAQAAGAISCPTVTSCVAVAGVFEEGHGFVQGSAAYRLTGDRWTARALPLPKGSDQVIADAVSCASASWCVAVGQQFSSKSSDDAGLVETLRGTKWTATTAGGEKATTTALLSVSCPAAGSCLAVGGRTPEDGANQPIAVRLSQGHWTVHAFGQPGINLAGVSCTTARACTAVGSKGQGGNSTAPVIAKWMRDQWTLRQLAGRAALEEVSCPATNVCRSTVGYDTHDRVDTIDGWRLTATPLALPAGPPVAALGAVSCSSVSRCVAVGGYSAVNGDHNLVETRDAAGNWAPTTVPTVKGTYAGFYGISCAPGSRSGSGCVAVGGGAVAVLTGGHWRGRLLPVPAGSRGVFLNGVSCPAVRRCLAVGSIQPPHSADDVPLVAILTGTRWKVTLLHAPSGVTYSTLEGVSCPSVGNCMAVGTSSAGPDDFDGLAERLKNGAWTAGSPNGYLTAVACPRTTSWCVAAAGNAVERWNGSTWSYRTVGGEGTPVSANAVACSSARLCTIAGDDGIGATGLWILTVSPTHVSARHAVTASAGVQAAGLSGIACPSGNCVVVGGDGTSTGSYALAGTVTP